ncbi:hypothetical protein ACP275_14G037600 [Erythranthe tilingii]
MAKKQKGSISNLPPEIIEIILSKLSVKSLLRFKSVSKSWNTTISDPVFIRKHLRNSNTSPNNLFLKYTTTKPRFTLVRLKGRKLDTEAVLDSPYNCNAVVLCECDGMLLLWCDSSTVYSKYVLWNPLTRRRIDFHCPYGYDQLVPIESNKFALWHSSSRAKVSAGICHDAVTDDYKVVLISRTKCVIYSCRDSSWKVNKFGTRKYNDAGRSGVSVDGAIYWVLGRKLVKFDPRNDELETLKKPKELYNIGANGRFYNLACLNGKLSLYWNGETSIRLWTKEKGIIGNNPYWEEFVIIEKNVGCYPTRRLLEPLCVVGNKILIGLSTIALRKRRLKNSKSTVV